MSRGKTLVRLGTRNVFRAAGRLVILVFLLATALVARSAGTLAQAGLCREAVDAVAPGNLPGDANVIVYSPEISYTPQVVDQYMRAISLAAYWSHDYIAAHYDRYFGPGGRLRVVRPCNEGRRMGRWTGDLHEEENWFSRIEGRYPTSPDELAVPEPFAAATGLGVGDTLALTAEKTGRTDVFTISGVYEPKGAGPFYEHLLSVNDPAKPVEVNMLVAHLDTQAIGVLWTWGNPNAAEVIELVDPRERMAELARTAYSTQSSAMNLGFALVGVAVLVVLLVAMVERRREAAIYKMVGLNSVATLGVLAVELVWAFGLSIAVAAPVYWYLATRYILDVHGADIATLLPPFVSSSLWTFAIAALGAGYPFALSSMGTPNQLMTKQKIYIFRRKYVLRGWTDGDAE